MALKVSDRETLDFTQLFNECFDDVYHYVISLVTQRVTAEEVTAQAFEKAYRKRDSFRPKKGSPRSWVFGIARNEALMELRKRKLRSLFSNALTDDPVDDSSLSADQQIEANYERELMLSAIDRLTQREQELVTLKFGCALSNREIAQTLSISESNAGTSIHRVVEKLRSYCHEAL